MSDKKEKSENEDIVILNGRFLPPKIWEEQPGIDPQKQRSHHLKHKHKTPLSFMNVLYGMMIKIPCIYVVCSLIKFFLTEFIRTFFWQIFLVIFVLLVLYCLYAQTIVKNAPDLQEELLFNGSVNLVSFIAGFVLSIY